MGQMRAATIDQILRTSEGSLMTVDADVLDIAKQLTEIDPCLRLRYSGSGGHFVVYEVIDRGPGKPPDEHLVTTAQECDQRILERVRKIRHPDYDFGAELDRLDREREAEVEHRFHEQVGEAGEHLHQLLKPKKRKAFIPGYIERKMNR